MSAPALPRCPRCDARMVLDPDGDRLWCQFCGTTRDDADAQQIAAAQQAATAADRHDYQPPGRDLDMTLEQHRLLDSAWQSIHEGDPVSARYVLNTALSRYENFADAWYLLALTTADRAERLMYLDRALAAQPYHEYAWRDKGVLEGVIPAQDAPDLAEPGGPVEAESAPQACPTCGGALSFDAATGALRCRHCGYQPGDTPRAHYRGGYDRLENALLQRRFGFSREWHIGARVLACANCAAQITLSSTAFSAICPFCDSAHVLVQDAVGSFEEPDALLPFALDRAAAARAIHAALDPALRARVVRGDLQGVYLPFWAFEGLVSVIFPAERALDSRVTGGAYAVGDVLVGAIAPPAQAILAALMPFDLDALTRYDARYLAQWPARLYQEDVVQASLTARAYLKHAGRQRALGSTLRGPALARTDSRAYRTPNDPLWDAAEIAIEGLNYRFILLPVWFATLHLEGGTHLPAYVNGQTGEAVIASGFTRAAQPVNRRARPIEPAQDASTAPPVAPPPQSFVRRSSVIRPLAPRPPLP